MSISVRVIVQSEVSAGEHLIKLHLSIDSYHHRESWHRDISSYTNQMGTKINHIMTKRAQHAYRKFCEFLSILFSIWFVGSECIRRARRASRILPGENSHAVDSKRGNSKMWMLHNLFRTSYEFRYQNPRILVDSLAMHCTTALLCIKACV